MNQIFVKNLRNKTITIDVDKNDTLLDIKKKINEDPRYTKFSSSDKKCEKEFNNWV